MGRPSIFLSYSREDKKYADALYRHLHAFRFQHGGDVFMDTVEIGPGDPWPDSVRRALETSRAFAVLISSNFFNSSFCFQQELPAIIDRYRNRDAEIFLIFVAPYANWTEYIIRGQRLGDIQGAGPFDEKGRQQWLSHLEPDYDAALTAIVTNIHRHFGLGQIDSVLGLAGTHGGVGNASCKRESTSSGQGCLSGRGGGRDSCFDSGN
jgi:hypothetical protein